MGRSMTRAWMAATALALALGVAVGACRNDAKNCVDTDAAAIDTPLLAYLSAARALHHQANIKEDSNDLPGAIASLEQLVATKPPRQAPEVEEVLADAYARMAELRIRTKDTAGALRDVDLGLAHAKEPTYFRGHLLDVQAIALEEQAKTLDAQGKKDDAQAARARALAISQEVVKIQLQVIDRALGAQDGGTK
jgi:hypothetical protein